MTNSSIDLDWQFWSSQMDTLRKLREQNSDIVVYRGGYGSGKTFVGARWIILTALEYHGSTNLVLGQDFKKGEDTYETLFQQLPADKDIDPEQLNPYKAGDPEKSFVIKQYNANKKRLVFSDDFGNSVIRLGSADKWNRYAGAEFNAIWADEVAHYDNTDLYKLNEMMISRQRTEQGPNMTLWTSTGNGYNQFYDFTEKQVTPDGDDLPTKIELVIADSRNNPFLPQKEKLVRQFEGTQRMEEALEGGFSSVEGLVYDNFNRTIHIKDKENVELDDEWGRVYAYDEGWGDHTVMLEIGKTTEGQLVAVDHFYENRSTVGDAIEWLVDNEKLKGRIYSEHNPKDIREMRKQLGWPVVRADKDIDSGIKLVRDKFKLDHKERPGLIVLDDCQELIKELVSYKEEDVGGSDVQDHACDCLRYALMGIDSRGGKSKGVQTGSVRAI